MEHSMVLEIIILVAVIGVFVIVARKIPQMASDRRQNTIRPKIKIFNRESSQISVLDKADAAFNQKDFASAEDFYIQSAAGDPHNPKIYNRLGVIYLEKKNYKDAKDAFLETLKYQDKPVKMASRYYNYALVCKELQEYRNAAEALEKAIELDKKNKKYKQLLEEINQKLS